MCTPLIFLGPLNDTMLDLNKFKIIRNSWRIDLPRLPAHQTENAEYLQNTDMWASHLLGPIKLHYNTF